ncbi:alpha/beta fold hydrolase [Marinobacter sp. V034]|uniref:alpha/beta fold hydrolase n=1 Tax=Marinobacter sp. V034 TaxID=3459610 RepID=UPI004043E7A2
MFGSRNPGSFTGKLFSAAINAAERRLYSDHFNVSNRSPYDVIYADGIMSVRHYYPLEVDEITVGTEPMSVAPDRHPVPLILVPPLAATSMIFDLLPQRSVVRYFLARGFDVYLIDWGEVTADHSDLSLETYVLDWMPAALTAVRERSGQQDVSVFAYCMGGLLALMYAAVSQDRHIRNMVTVASPVDMHQMGIAGGFLSAIYRPARVVSEVLNFSLMDLPARYFHVPGWFNSLAFKLTNPIGSAVSSLELAINMWDREYVKVHSTMQKWFNEMVDYPGETIKGMVVHMALNNSMARGNFKLGGSNASFDNIHCAILAFAGDTDRIVRIPSAHKVLDIVSSEDREFCVVPGGHAGVFAGASAPENTWRISADWLDQRSGEKRQEIKDKN